MELLSLDGFPLRVLSNSISERGEIVGVIKIDSISISRLYSTVGGNFSASKSLFLHGIHEISSPQHGGIHAWYCTGRTWKQQRLGQVGKELSCAQDCSVIHVLVPPTCRRREGIIIKNIYNNNWLFFLEKEKQSLEKNCSFFSSLWVAAERKGRERQMKWKY